jgi:flagellar biosynthesis/type III secretory pathway protein FliH
MTAIPLARFLVDFGIDADYRADGLHQGMRAEAAVIANANVRIAESRDRGYAEGRAAAEAEFAAKLDLQQKDFEQQLATARQGWAASEGNALSEAFVHALQDLEARLATTIARILRPFLETEVRHAAVAELATTIKTILARDQAIRIEISGPDDLLDVLRSRLADKVTATFTTSQGCDVRVVIGQTTLETQLAAWIAAMEEAAR